MDRRTLLKLSCVALFTPINKVWHSLINTQLPSHIESISMKIQRLAWAGIKIEIGSTTLFIDTISEGNQENLKTQTNNVHALITHHHTDHYDISALKNILNEKSWLIYYHEVSSLIDARNFRSQTVKLFEPIFIPRLGTEFTIIAVPAVDGFGHPQVSWIVTGGGKRIIHCGDTLWHGHWWDIAQAFRPFDAAFLPINGFRKISGRFTDSGISMCLTPQQAVAAAKILGAKTVCPIHYGKPSENYFEVDKPENNFILEAARKEVNTSILKEGEGIAWP